MDIIDAIGQSQGGQGFAELAQQFGLSEEEARAAVAQLAPAVMAGIRRNTQSSDGISSLVQALATGDHQRYLNGSEEDVTDDGNAILGHVFGSKDVSRGVAANAAQLSGVGGSILKRMLPVVAAMVMGALARNMMGGGRSAGGQQAGAGGGLGDVLGQVLGGGAAAGGLGGILGSLLGGGAGGAGGGAGGLGDILGGMLGGGAQSSPAPRPQAGDGGIGDILGNIFGQNAPPEVRQAATKRAEQTLGRTLGAGTASGNDADELLTSIDRALRQR
jgi:hypothetical protein